MTGKVLANLILGTFLVAGIIMFIFPNFYKKIDTTIQKWQFKNAIVFPKIQELNYNVTKQTPPIVFRIMGLMIILGIGFMILLVNAPVSH